MIESKNIKNGRDRGVLKDFGKILFSRFDIAIENLAREINETDRASSAKFHKYFSKLSREEREIEIAQYALEIFVHDLMAFFQESDDFFIVFCDKDGKLRNLRDIAVPSLEFEQCGWLDDFSNHESVVGKTM